jgi:hypothetical protein
MASPAIEVLFFYSASTGAPLTGLTPTFTTYTDTSATPVAQPVISEIGGGAYKFTPVLTASQGIVYVVDGGATASPRYQTRYIRTSDFAGLDDVLTLLKYAEGRYKIFTSGPDANRLVLYDTDDVTVLIKFDLYNSAGSAAASNTYERVPV